MTERIGVSEFDIPSGTYVPIEEYNKIKQQRDKLIEEYNAVCRQLDKLRRVCEDMVDYYHGRRNDFMDIARRMDVVIAEMEDSDE